MFAAGDLRQVAPWVYAEKSGRKAGSLITQDWGRSVSTVTLFAAGEACRERQVRSWMTPAKNKVLNLTALGSLSLPDF